MDHISIIEKMHQNLENRDFDRVAELLTEDFVFLGQAPESLNKEEFIATHKMLLSAISEFKYNLADLHQAGDTVFGSLKIEGVHSAALDLSLMSGPLLEPTFKSFSMPRDFFQITIKDSKVALIISEPSHGGGLLGMMAILEKSKPGHLHQEKINA